jgi:chitobiase/beta-hexosaminidase-like protein/VCBS repeat protein
MKAASMPFQLTTTERVSRWGASLMFALAAGVGSADAAQDGLTQRAVGLMNDLITAARSAFFVYKDSDSGENNGFLSGWFPGGPALAKIHLNTACVYDPASPSGCTVDPDRFDRLRGTVIQITFDPLTAGQFAGINVEEPENYGVNPRGFGFDLRGASRVCFDFLSPTSPANNFKVQFAVAQHPTAFVDVPAQWTARCFDLASMGVTSTDLMNVHFPFTVVTNDRNAAAGGTVLLDNIRFEPVPLSQANVVSFPLANKVVGARPVRDVMPGRVKIPPDQVLANLTTIYESAMVVLTLLATGDPTDATNAREIVDAFVYALNHDNQGVPIPVGPAGSAGLHNGMFSGNLALFNDQGPGAGRRGQVRLAGFRIESNLCGPSHFCLVLDGATGGNNAFVILALIEAYGKFHDQRYLNAARSIGNWIHGTLLDTTGTGFGGYYLGYPDEGQAKQLIKGKSIENNADIFRAFTALAAASQGLGLTPEADEWTRRAEIAGDFVLALFDPAAGRFYAGTVPRGIPPSPGISPDGPQRGDDVINTYDFLDAETFTTLPLAPSPRYRNSIDWRRPVQWMVDHFSVSVTAQGQQYHGFNLVTAPTEGPNGIAWEFTAQAIVTMRLVDDLYNETTFETAAQFYVDQIRSAHQSAPFTDARGVVAATLQDGNLVPLYEQCLSTPFQCIAQRVGLAATTWSILAELNVNPFVGRASAPTFDPMPGTYMPNTSVTISSATAGATIRYTTDGSNPDRTSGTIYTAPIRLTTNTVIKALAIKAGMPDSVVTAGTYAMCSFVLSATHAEVDATGSGAHTVTVITPAGCPWTVSDDMSKSWLTMTGRVGGPVNTTVTYTVRPNTGFLRTAVLTIAGQPFEVTQAAGCVRCGRQSRADFDGDGQADISVFRRSDGRWDILTSSSSYSSSRSFFWGVSTDVPVTGDYDGDGTTDIGVFRPATGQWYILQSSTNFTTFVMYFWGAATDLAVPGDYDGDGKTDVAVFRPATGQWYILKSSTNFTTYIVRSWGVASDVPVPADYDGDGKTDMAVYRPATGEWYVLQSSTDFTTFFARGWGLPTDLPVPADYDADGITDMAVYRPSTGEWFILLSTTNFTTFVTYTWGRATDIPLCGDFDGDGRTDIVVFRPSTGEWWILKSSTNYSTSFHVIWGAGETAVIDHS